MAHSSHSRSSTGVHYFVEAKSRRHVTDICVWIPVHSFAEFRIGKEERWDRFAKSLGISSELQTGETGFDDKYYISTDSLEFTHKLLRKVNAREAITKILTWGFDEVIHDGRYLMAKANNVDPTFRRDQLYLDTADELVKIGNIMSETVVTVPPVFFPGKVRRTLSLTFSALLFIGGIALAIWSHTHFEPVAALPVFVKALPLSSIAFIIYLFLQFIFLSGRSSTHREIALIAFLCVFAAPLLSYGGYLYVNGAYDDTSDEAATLIITQKFERKTPFGSALNYNAVTKSWTKKGENIVWDIDWDTYKKIQLGSSRVLLALRGGYLDIPWIRSRVVAP